MHMLHCCTETPLKPQCFIAAFVCAEVTQIVGCCGSVGKADCLLIAGLELRSNSLHISSLTSATTGMWMSEWTISLSEEAKRTMSPTKSTEVIWGPPKCRTSTIWLCLEILSIKVMNPGRVQLPLGTSLTFCWQFKPNSQNGCTGTRARYPILPKHPAYGTPWRQMSSPNLILI